MYNQNIFFMTIIENVYSESRTGEKRNNFGIVLTI